MADLERLDRASGAVLERLGTEQSIVQGAVILATCNRFEVYYETENMERALEFITETVSTASGIDPVHLAELAISTRQAAVPQHLFAVSSGLRSMIVGEEEISGQVKRAMAKSQGLGLATKSLNLLFQTAAKVSKQVTSNTSVGATGRSVVSAALELATSNFGETTTKRALLIGTGAYARVAVATLERQGFAEIFVYSRTGRAAVFSQTHPTTPISRDQLHSVMAEVDLVVCASGLGQYAIEVSLAEAVAATRADHENSNDLILIDVALARDIAPEVGHVAGMHLIDLDRLKLEHTDAHSESIESAELIVANAVESFEKTLQSNAIDPIVAALHQHFGHWVENEVAAVRRKAGDETADVVAKSLRRVTKGLLHAPSMRAKEMTLEGNQDEYLRALNLLFEIDFGGNND